MQIAGCGKVLERSFNAVSKLCDFHMKARVWTGLS